MPKGLGWILFAWFMLLLAGVMNMVDGMVMDVIVIYGLAVYGEQPDLA